MNELILGDNLDIMQKMSEASVDLIYLDPPFFSNRNYEVIWGDKGEIRSFEDRWSGGIDHYIAWLKIRIEEMYRILKPTGSIFLHCDSHASHYIKTDILDKIFGVNNFNSEIIWKRQTAKKGSQFAKKTFGFSHDSILFYNKSVKYFFEIPKVKLDDKRMFSKFNKVDENGRRFRLDNIERNSSLGERPNLVYEYKGYTPGSWGWMVNRKKLEQMDKEGRLYWNEKKRPYRKYFSDEYEGQEVTNIWDDIYIASGGERIGYPTQKPEKLLERIILCATKENDTVLDPYVGGGTTVVVANRLNRNWIGIDQSVQAIKVSEMRITQKQNLFSLLPFAVRLHKYDYDTLRYKDAFKFESWIIQQFGGVSNTKQRGDYGIDGKIKEGTPIQVKRSEDIGRNIIDNFKSSCERYNKKLFEKNKNENQPIGIIIAFSFGKGAVQEVARLKNDENIVIKLLRVEEIIPIAKKPTLKVELQDLGLDKNKHREIEFIAEAHSEAGIELYAWCWEYKNEKFSADVMFDKSGKQTQKFKAGNHTIAVKAIDNDGLETIEVIKLQINGGIKREEKQPVR